MQVKPLPLVEIKPYWRNPRLNDAAVPLVKASIEQFGFNQPILVDVEGVIIAGHTRYRAAMELALKEVPVIVLDLPADKVKAYRIADNKPGEMSEWDPEKLIQELREIPDVQKLEVFFQPDELERMMASVTDLNTSTATQGQVNAAAAAVNGGQTERSVEAQGRYVSTSCPHCLKAYFLDREEMLKARADVAELPDGVIAVRLDA